MDYLYSALVNEIQQLKTLMQERGKRKKDKGWAMPS